MTRLRSSAARLLLILAASGALASCLRDPQARIDRERTETFDLLTKGQQLKAQGDLVLARDTFLKAAEKSPDRPILFYEIGNCHYQLGNPEQAEAYYEKALALAPDYSLAKAELDLVRQQLKNAPPATEKAVAAVPPPASPIETPIATAPAATFTPVPTPEPTPESKQIAQATAPRPTPTPEPTKTPKPKAPEPTKAPAQPAPAVAEPTPSPEPTAITPAVEETPVPTIAPEATPEPSEPVATPEPTPSPEETPDLKVKDVFEEEKKPAVASTEAAKSTKTEAKKDTTKKSDSIEEPKDGPVSGPFGGVQRAFSGLSPDKPTEPGATPAPVQPGDARKVIFPELTTDRMPTAAEDRAAALRAEELGYSDEAVRAWRRYLMREPDDISARLSLGTALQRSGRSLRAEEEFDVAQKLAPENPNVYFERGNFHVRAKELVKAQACFTKAIELDPKNLRAKNNLGAVQQQLGNHSAALEIIREVLDEDPAFASAWLNLALAQDDAGLPPADIITSIENYMRLSKAPDPKTERWLTGLKKKVAIAR
jgi:tetratricopeptide (TPR) repeat protein